LLAKPTDVRLRVMSFVLGVILFVGVLGVLDRKLPWPRRGA
jgi:hypothetical protein